MKALTLITEKLWPMLNFFANRQEKLYAPDLLMQGHKKTNKNLKNKV